MTNLTLTKVGGICLTVLTVAASLVGIIGFILDWWGPDKNQDETMENPALSAQPETAPQPAPETPTPTPSATVVSDAEVHAEDRVIDSVGLGTK